MMKGFIRFCDKIKYLGILGLPSLFLENRLFDFLWLFWLFGLVPIFHNPAVFWQSLKQLWGMLIIPLRYGARIPSAAHYNSRVKYSLPFHGTWAAVNGGVEKATSHSWGIQDTALCL